MASFSLTNSSTYQGRKIRVAITSTIDIGSNTSTLNWTLYSEGGSATFYSVGPTTLKINGQQVYYIKRKNWDTQAFPAKKGSVSGSLTVAHDNNGDKSVSVSLTTAVYSSTTKTSTGTMVLDHIPRYATSNQSVANKTETSITMNWSSDNIIDYIWYSTNGGSSWTGINVVDGTSGAYTISGLSANTTYSIKTRVRRRDSQLTTDSSALSVTTYNYPYCNSMPNFTIGNKLTLGFYNPLGRNITVNIIGADNSQISSDTTSGTSISGYNGSTIVNNLYASIPNSQSGTYKVKVTYGSSVITKTGGTYSVNANVCSPSIESATYQDTNASVVAITDNNQLIVRNQSKVQFNASGLTTLNSATISSCSVSINGVSNSMSVSGTTASVNNINIDSSSNLTAIITLTDSRGLTATKNVDVTMLDWVLPTGIISLERQNNFYSTTYITVDGNYSSVDGKNTITIQVRYKKTSDTTWSSYVTLQDNVQSTLTLDNLYEWDVQVLLTDLFGSTTYNLTLQKGMPIFYVDRLLNSVGINCFPKDEDSFENNGINLERNVMTRSLSANVTNLSVSTYTIVPLDLSNNAGSKLTATNDGGIQIGANVSKILVSGRASIVGSSTTGRRHLRIMKNSYTNNNTIAWSQDDFAASVTEDIVITPTLGDVQEGDVIYLWYYVPNSADTIGGNTYGARTSLTVEVIE